MNRRVTPLFILLTILLYACDSASSAANDKDIIVAPYESEVETESTEIVRETSDQSWTYDEIENVVQGENDGVIYDMKILNSSSVVNVYLVNFDYDTASLSYTAESQDVYSCSIQNWYYADDNSYMFYQGYNLEDVGIASIDSILKVCNTVGYCSTESIDNVSYILDYIGDKDIYPYAISAQLHYDEECHLSVSNYETGEVLEWPIDIYTIREQRDGIPLLTWQLPHYTLKWNDEIKGCVYGGVANTITDGTSAILTSIINNMVIIEKEYEDLSVVPIIDCMPEIQRIVKYNNERYADDFYVYAAELCYVPIMEVSRYYVTPVYDDDGNTIIHLVPVWAIYYQSIDEGANVSNFGGVELVNAVTGEGMGDYAD